MIRFPKKNMSLIIASAILLIILTMSDTILAQVSLVENDSYELNMIPYVRTDVITLKNNVDLDSNNSNDTTTYFGLDYSLGFDIQFKNDGLQAFLKLERNGPYDYDAPLFIHNTLTTSTDRMENYDTCDLFPGLEEYWVDVSLIGVPGTRLKSGLFGYEVGNGIALGGGYENYGLSLYNAGEDFSWRIHYIRPDLVNKSIIGPHVKQEAEQGIDYEHTNANMITADMSFSLKEIEMQPYVGVLLDRTNGKRTNYFTTPTNRDLLGTLGLALDFVIDKLSVSTEVARNFGKAKSSDSAFEDVEHAGYVVYVDTSYDMDKLTPHSRFVFASGNKVTTDMVNNSDTELTSGKNRAFSVYSPLNANLADSVYPSIENLPLVAMAEGYGLNYGISRPTTFLDPFLLDNVMLPNLGFDYELTEKLSFTLDWWHLRSAEKGVGSLNGTARKLSSELGNEIDLFIYYELNDNVNLSLLSGYFFPGDFYEEQRDDVDWSLLTPFVRGDGKANGAYQIELVMEIEF